MFHMIYTRYIYVEIFYDWRSRTFASKLFSNKMNFTNSNYKAAIITREEFQLIRTTQQSCYLSAYKI